MIVSITVVTPGADGGDAGASPVGILPARTVANIAHVKATANIKRFISGFSFGFEDARQLAFRQNRAVAKLLAGRCGWG